MISATSVDDGYKIEAYGDETELSDEVTGIICAILQVFHEKAEEYGGKDFAKKYVKSTFFDMAYVSIQRVKDSLGFDIMEDFYEDEQPVQKANPFTMGMSGETFAQFLKDMKGEV